MKVFPSAGELRGRGGGMALHAWWEGIGPYEKYCIYLVSSQKRMGASCPCLLWEKRHVLRKAPKPERKEEPKTEELRRFIKIQREGGG